MSKSTMTSAQVASLAILSIVFIVLFVGIVKFAEKKSCPSNLVGQAAGVTETSSVASQDFCYDSDSKGKALLTVEEQSLVPGYISDKLIPRELAYELSNGNDIILDYCQDDVTLIEQICKDNVFGNRLSYQAVDCSSLVKNGVSAVCLSGQYGASCAFP